MSTNSLTESPNGTLRRALANSFGSLAGAPGREIVLTKYANISADRQLPLAQQINSETDQNANCNYCNHRPSKQDLWASNKLWTSASPQACCERICVGVAGALEQHRSREPFQIVWTDLSFQVNLSAYDKAINGLLKATQTLSQLRGRANTLAARGEQDQEANFAATTTTTTLDADYATKCRLATTAGDKRTIFENLNGYVNSGEITAILGPSGAGKTSLLNAICGRTDNYGGRIRLLGGDHKQRMRLSIIPQKDYLIENLTVRENLLYSSKILNPDSKFEHEANIMRVVRMLNLTTCFNSLAANISGGEYKRVSIAQELLRQPDILILDEPTSGLDSLNCKNLIRSLASLIEASRRGALQPIAILMTIHQPDVDIFNMFHHVYCMARGGRVIYDGHPRDATHIIRSHAGLNPMALDLPVDAEQALACATSSNPANLLIEIASEEIYGPEPIERLAKLHRKQFEQLACRMHANGESGQQQQEQEQRQRQQQLQLNLLTAATIVDECDQNGCKIGRSLNGYFKQPPVDNGASVPLTPHSNSDSNSNSSSSSLNSSATSKISAFAGKSLVSSSDGALDRPSLTSIGGLIRDKRLNAKHDHSGRFWYHTRVLASRAFVSTVRDPLMTMISLFFHLSIPFVMWTVYPKRIGYTQACPIIQREMDMISMASNRTAERLEDLQEQLTTTFECSTMFFLTTYSFSMCSLTVASLAFPLNMHILLKEVRNGWYNLPSYVLAKTLANFPFEVLFPVISLVMIYLMLGMPSSAYEWRLLAIALVMALVSMISHTQGLIFGALCMDSVQTAIFLASASSLPQTLLSGFTARIKYMPIMLQKISWLSQYRYSSDLINMIRFGFGICPCDSATDEYLRNRKPDFKDVPDHLKPIFIFYLTANSGTGNESNSSAPTTQLLHDSESNTTATATISSLIVSNVTQALTTTVESIVNETRIPGVEHELMLNELERSELLKRMESGEVDLFARMADMTGRSFTYGRALDGCQSVRSQILMTAGTPADEHMPLMFGCMFVLLIACKLILFLVVRHKIGSRV